MNNSKNNLDMVVLVMKRRVLEENDFIVKMYIFFIFVFK